MSIMVLLIKPNGDNFRKLLTNSDAIGSTNNFRKWVNDETFLKWYELLTGKYPGIFEKC